MDVGELVGLQVWIKVWRCERRLAVWNKWTRADQAKKIANLSAVMGSREWHDRGRIIHHAAL
eukprot:49269-Eustigmatos_ZCMA.PRE.1